MKHLKFLAAVCCMLAVFTACEKNDPNDNTNGNDSVFAATGTANGYGYVDLGLSVKWATCNVGATTPTGYGDYYAWGETEPNTTYYWNTYKWATATQGEWGDWNLETLTKYNTESIYGTVDNKTVLELADDAARANWGGAWRMPTDAEWTELCENCTWTWTTRNDVKGYMVKSNINGNSIFLPAAGYRYDYGCYDAGDFGRYRSSSLSTYYPYGALSVYFDSDDVSWDNDYRFVGLSVRPVCE